MKATLEKRLRELKDKKAVLIESLNKKCLNTEVTSELVNKIRVINARMEEIERLLLTEMEQQKKTETSQLYEQFWNGVKYQITDVSLQLISDTDALYNIKVLFDQTIGREKETDKL